MQFWCSASGQAWTWTWRAYPGIWLFVLGLASWYWWLYRRSGTGVVPRDRASAAAIGVLCVWAALDWPLGALGAGYLLWAHTAQFLLLAMLAPPLLLYGLPAAVVADVEAGRVRPGVVTRLLQPLPAAVLFNVVVVLTHFPAIVDGLMVFQLGAAVLDLAWLVIGVAFWWPVLYAPPGRRLLAAPLRIAYVLASTFSHMGIGIIMSVVSYPLYSLYELAPPTGVLRLDDQSQAGGLMLGGSTLIVFTTIMLLAYAWARAELAAERRASGGPG